MPRSRNHCRIDICVVFALIAQRIVHVAALFSFVVSVAAPLQVRLICKHDEKFGLLAVGSVLNHPRRDLYQQAIHRCRHCFRWCAKSRSPRPQQMPTAMNQKRKATSAIVPIRMRRLDKRSWTRQNHSCTPNPQKSVNTWRFHVAQRAVRFGASCGRAPPKLITAWALEPV